MLYYNDVKIIIDKVMNIDTERVCGVSRAPKATFRWSVRCVSGP